MKFKKIITEVQTIVDNPDYGPEEIKGFINECVVYVASLVELPGLRRIGTVQTAVGQPYASLSNVSGGFSGRLLKTSLSGIVVYPSLDMLMDDYVTDTYQTLNQEGSLEAVAIDGSTLWYQYVPTEATDITFLYLRNPSQLSEDNDEPSDYPVQLHRKLFVHGTAWLIYDQMEDGMEGKKSNTTTNFWESFNEDNRHSGILKLKEWISRNRNNYISSSWNV